MSIRLYYEYSEEELNAINKLSGIERVRKSICGISNVLPDEDSRVFPTVITEAYKTFKSSTIPFVIA